MSQETSVASWDAQNLGGDLIALSVSGRGGDGLHFEAAGERGEFLLDKSQLDSFLEVHRQARFVVPDVGAFWVAVEEHRTALMNLADQGRLYDFQLLADLVNLAEPGIDIHLEETPGAWGRREGLLGKARRLLAHAEHIAERFQIPRDLITRFGPVAIGIEVKGAIAAAALDPGLRVSSQHLQSLKASLRKR